MKRCRICKGVVGDSYANIIEDDDLVILDTETGAMFLMKKGECLCNTCNSPDKLVYYRKV